MCQCGIHRMSSIDGGENQERVKCQESIQGLRIESRINRINRINRIKRIKRIKSW